MAAPHHPATYQRPVQGTLHVHLDNGDTWQATDDDLAKFGLVEPAVAYMRFRTALDSILRSSGLLEGDLTDACLNPLRYLVETAVRHPDLLDHPDHEGWRDVADLERTLQIHRDSVTG